MKIKDLLIKEKSYIVNIEIPKTNYVLFVECLNEFGEMIQEEFKEEKCSNINNLCVELFKRNENGVFEYYETIDVYDINANEKIDDLIEKTLNLLEGENND